MPVYVRHTQSDDYRALTEWRRLRADAHYWATRLIRRRAPRVRALSMRRVQDDAFCVRRISQSTDPCAGRAHVGSDYASIPERARAYCIADAFADLRAPRGLRTTRAGAGCAPTRTASCARTHTARCRVVAQLIRARADCG